MSVVPDGLVVDAECVMSIAHVTVGPPLGSIVTQLLDEGQVGFMELQCCLILSPHLVYDA